MAAQKHFEICKEKQEGKGRARSQFIRVKIFFYEGCVWRGGSCCHLTALAGWSPFALLGWSCFVLEIDCGERMSWGQREVIMC